MYMSGRMITVHDIYSFDPDVRVELEEFTDVIGRNFRQPRRGSASTTARSPHMWRAMIRPASICSRRASSPKSRDRRTASAPSAFLYPGLAGVIGPVIRVPAAPRRGIIGAGAGG